MLDETNNMSDATGTLRAAVLPVIASSAAFIVPLALSYSTSPAPQHPRVLFWYWSLQKPAFKPKDWVIPAAWFGIEACLARAVYRLMRAPPSAARVRSLALLAWNIVMIGGWSRLFFGKRNLPVSTFAAATMIGTGAAYVNAARKVDQPAARAGIPFVAWVSFATVLTATIWALNRRRPN